MGSRQFAWFLLLSFLGLVALACVVSPASAHRKPNRPWGLRVIHKTDHAVRSTRRCQRYLERQRDPQRSARTYVKQRLAFRLWALRLWRGRERRCGQTVRRLDSNPPLAIMYVFRRLGDDDVAQALHVASEEAGRHNIWKYPHCTRVDNGVGFLGCFQMGPWARTRYGHGSSALDQAWAAFNYRVAVRGWCSGWSATAWGC